MGSLNEAAAAMGRKGGLTRAKNMTKRQRSEACRYAAQCRWAKKAKADGKKK